MRAVPSEINGSSAGAVREAWDRYRADYDRRQQERRVACAEWCAARGLPVSSGLVAHLLLVREIDGLGAVALEAEANRWLKQRSNRRAA